MSGKLAIEESLRQKAASLQEKPAYDVIQKVQGLRRKPPPSSAYK